ncbi:hypothetical protein AURDEDRAFT_178627 [Auricularia subglabra TFB-10046 SS5]|uniref:Uncharacterized protein n=1 Tax=Auricularia subglabra (strain TFB-10046 / SS5) TaxID=717982 RepID=J0CQ32_AURST|nr:hypothetical protein AURDEDRAFT_178627 [Auricularia subglabra TFB-10046 SS5]
MPEWLANGHPMRGPRGDFHVPHNIEGLPTVLPAIDDRHEEIVNLDYIFAATHQRLEKTAAHTAKLTRCSSPCALPRPMPSIRIAGGHSCCTRRRPIVFPPMQIPVA